MKILHVNFSDNFGGAAISVMRLHKLLLKKGLDSHLLVSERNTDTKNVICMDKTSEKIKNILKNAMTRNLKFFFKTENKNTHSLNIIPSNLIKIINEFDADVVNLHWLGNETLSIKQISKIKTKVVWTCHDMWPFCGAEHYTFDKRFETGYFSNNRPKYEKGYDINRMIWQKKIKNFKKINNILATSKWMEKQIKNSYLFKEKKIKYIPLVLDQQLWRPIANIDSVREVFGLSNNKKIITFGSDNYSSNNRKGLDFFLMAIKKLSNNPNYEFVIFGENNEEKFRKIEKDFNLKDKIKNLYKINDETQIKLLYSISDVVVSPSILEAFGLIVYESLHMGTPCVVFNETGSETLVSHKKNGYICNYKSLDDLVNGIIWVIDNLSDKSNVHNHTISKFNTEQIIVDYLKFLKS